MQLAKFSVVVIGWYLDKLLELHGSATNHVCRVQQALNVHIVLFYFQVNDECMEKRSSTC